MFEVREAALPRHSGFRRMNDYRPIGPFWAPGYRD
jgi:hypothetical protein